MYEVIKYFTDLQDFNHPYNVGDVFPRTGLVVSDARCKELASANNKQGEALIRLKGAKTETKAMTPKVEEKAEKSVSKRGRKKSEE